MIRFKFLNVIFALLILAVLNSCGFYKRSDVKDNPVNVDERVRKNIYVKDWKINCTMYNVTLHVR